MKIEAETLLNSLASTPLTGLSRTDVVVLFILPNLRTAGRLLALKDANNTGADDEAAAAISYTVDRLEAYLESK